ncbi:MAG: DUF1697 domain-containing protein [Betaproteobacteria bacterium]|nr:DUF1697 domain-containing protein [Betaproteobacteria bacterium]
MTTFVALLRGINVSGRNMIRMADLQQSFAALKLDNVQTYLQSGNVLFSTGRTDAAALAATIKDRIADDLGHNVEVRVLTAKELANIASSNPLWPRLGADEKLFHGTFLFRRISQTAFRNLKLPAQGGEQAVLVGQTILLFCPHRYGKTKLNNGFFEKALSIHATTRNWRTVLALRELCERR